jgi:DNA-binding NtrC family response regulator
MAKLTWNDALNELRNAWKSATIGYKAESQKGIPGKLSPRFSPLDRQQSTPSSSSPDQSYAILERRLREVYEPYDRGEINYQEYERQKAIILSEI